MFFYYGFYFNLLIKNYWMRLGLVIFRVIKVDVGVFSFIEILIYFGNYRIEFNNLFYYVLNEGI